MRILVTNDDGIEAPGIAALAASVAGSDHEIIVAAPSIDASGSSAAVGPRQSGSRPVFTPVHLLQFEGLTSYSVDAFPALIVYEACRGAIGPPPEVVLSGINLGRNVGGAVVHSGTVGAALTASQLGRRALAMSIRYHGPTIYFETAGELAARLLPFLLSLRPASVLNCNVPNVALEELRGIRAARLSRTGPILPGAAEAADDGRDLETDDVLSLQGFATITPLLPASEDPDPSIAVALGTPLEAIASDLGCGHA